MGTSRTQVALAVLQSREADMVLVQDFYQKYLRRAADPGGLNAFTDLLQQGVRDEVVVADLVGSPEYLSLV